MILLWSQDKILKPLQAFIAALSGDKYTCISYIQLKQTKFSLARHRTQL